MNTLELNNMKNKITKLILINKRLLENNHYLLLTFLKIKEKQ
jgi:hypothetical protein